MYQFLSIVLLLVAIPTAVISCICKNTDDWQDAQTCNEVFEVLSGALTNNKVNLYRMKQALFYAPSADPVLIQVKYNISYSDNVTKDLEWLDYCANVNNTSAITINQTAHEIIRGWTSRGVYYVISPLLLNSMQMVLPFALLRIINNGLKSKFGSPEVDTLLWDGSYELPTLLIDLHITSLPCIPSEEVFNCTLEELNAYLKIYAKPQGLAQSHADDIAYTLSDGHMLSPDGNELVIPDAINYYCMFGIFLIGMFGLVLITTKDMKSISTHFVEHAELATSAVFVGLLLIVSEFLTTTIYLDDFLKYTGFHFYVWIFIPLSVLTITIFVIDISIILVCFKLKLCKRKKTNSFKFINFVKHIFISLIFVLFLWHIYCYALPTFLLLLVYPTKVITVVAYLITFVFAATVTVSISMRLTIQRYHTIGHGLHCFTVYTVIMMIIYGIAFLIFPVLMFGVVIYFLYALVLGEASAISAGPYTVLSLIPTAAISVATWLVKNKVFSSGAKKEDKNKESNKKNENNDEEQPAANNGETLTLVVNEETPFNGNSQAAETYGAADNK